MESLLLEKLGDNTINDYGDHQRSWLFATASMDSLGVIYWVDLCVCIHRQEGGEREWPSKFNFREMRKVSAGEIYRHVNEAIRWLGSRS